MNIMQEFIDINKKEFIDSQGAKIWQSICDGSALLDPERCLSRFGLLVYADLKKYNFYYWFSFPAINYPQDVYFTSQQSSSGSGDCSTKGSRPITEYFGVKALQTLQQNYEQAQQNGNFQRGYFIVVHNKTSEEVTCYPLSKYDDASYQSKQQDNVLYFAFTDPSSSRIHPGWPLRNFLSLIAVQFRLSQVSIIRIRTGLPSQTPKLELSRGQVLELSYELNDEFKADETPAITGWERNQSQQVAPKRVNLSNLLDPKKLAEDAVNLNLKLMKWRLLPGLDLDKIANTKCLLLGCGTLGCHIARGLLAWGVKEITIVDNSKISYSNPVRQTLYTFEECSKSAGVYKAEAAAANLRRIHPTVNVNAHVLSIPMPGHHIADKEIDQVRKDVQKLEELIQNHDATFLLMDTRESRWLPTVIGISQQKLIINAAIGFDTFLLQRYGIRNYSTRREEKEPQASTSSNLDSSPDSKACASSSDSGFKTSSHHQLESEKLGCYFCNDIVAPGDSTLDRTLDQQCTVSRPGVSMMVSAMAVELLASVVSSNMGAFTPAPVDVQNDPSMLSDEDFGSELGVVPHSIRGNLARYHIYMPTSPAFNKCSGCSWAVVNAYRQSGYEFLHRVFDDPSYLEEVAGLKELQNFSDDVWALGSDEILFEDSL